MQVHLNLTVFTHNITIYSLKATPKPLPLHINILIIAIAIAIWYKYEVSTTRSNSHDDEPRWSNAVAMLMQMS